jgi:hypothetical protein
MGIHHANREADLGNTSELVRSQVQTVAAPTMMDRSIAVTSELG